MVVPNKKFGGLEKGYCPVYVQHIRLMMQVEEIDIDAKDVRGVQTPLSLAVKAQNKEAVKLLIGNLI